MSDKYVFVGSVAQGHRHGVFWDASLAAFGLNRTEGFGNEEICSVKFDQDRLYDIYYCRL